MKSQEYSIEMAKKLGFTVDFQEKQEGDDFDRITISGVFLTLNYSTFRDTWDEIASALGVLKDVIEVCTVVPMPKIPDFSEN